VEKEAEDVLKTPEISGLAVLAVGVVLLAFTFYNAYGLLTGVLNIPATKDLLEGFGKVLGPLVETCIRAIYLGIMGWIGSILTIRGVQLLSAPRPEAKAEVKAEAKPEVKPEAKPEAKPETKPEAKPAETEQPPAEPAAPLPASKPTKPAKEKGK